MASPTTHPEGAGAPVPTDTVARRPAGDSWLAVLMVLLTFVGVAGGTLLAWWPVAPHPPAPRERYYPLADGVTQSYRVRSPSGPELYQSSNTELLEGVEAGAQLPADLLTRALSLSAGGDPGDDDETMLARAQRADGDLLRVARVVDTTYAASGPFTQTVGLYLVLPERVGLIAVDDTAIDPPLPILDTAMEVGASQEATGTFADLPYTATLALEAQEAIDTPAGRLDDCLRTRLDLAVGRFDALLVSWFCDGVGLARQDARSLGEVETRRYELAAASAPGLLRGDLLAPPREPDRAATPRGDDGLGTLAALPLEVPRQLWHYRMSGANVDITAPPLPAGDLLIAGAANGSLVAIDRATHEQRWRFQAGGAIVGAPVAAGGVLFFGANDRKVYALDLASGTFRWAFAAQDVISASPAVVGDTVYVGSEDRSVYALDSATGKERWRFTTGDAVVTAPALAGGQLFVGSNDGVLYALDAATGAPRWAFSTDDAITASPLVRDGVVYAGSRDGSLYALSAKSAGEEGELLWSYDAEDSIEADLALDATTVYLATGGGSLRAVDAASGAERWRTSGGNSFKGAPLAVGERVLIGGRSEILAFAASDGRILAPIPLSAAIDSYGLSTSISGDGGELFAGRTSGIVQVLGDDAGQAWASEPIWKADALGGELRARGDRLATPPALAGERLAGVSYGGWVYSVSPDDGSFQDHGQLSDGEVVVVPPAADAATLYAIDSSNTLIAFDLAGGDARWRFKLQGRTRSAPAVGDGRVLVAASGDAGTQAYAIDARSGKLLWRQQLGPSPSGAAYTLLRDGRFFVTAGSLQALDAATGEPLWATDGSSSAVQLAADGDVVYAIGFAGEQWLLEGWDAATGAPALRAVVDAPTFPAIEGGLAAGDGAVALLLHDSTLIALDGASGVERWRLRLSSAHRGAPAIAGGRVLVETRRNHLLAYALADGRLEGDYAILDDTGLADQSAVAPVLHDDRIYVAFYQGLAALRAAGADER